MVMSLVVTGQLFALEKSRAELELEQRAKQAKAIQARKQQAAEFQEVAATALKRGAKVIDWSLVPAEGSKDFDQKQAAFVEKYKDGQLVLTGALGKVYAYGNQTTNFLLHDPARPGAKLLVFIRDIDQQPVLKLEGKPLYIQVVGAFKASGTKVWTAAIAAEYIGEPK